ncbi:hypothetical protein G7054_g7330 [Neopestalotiopsis clavispora]|nr:hypothetical protein G7054_g7330 [Neopestalotiopsis clavispora]
MTNGSKTSISISDSSADLCCFSYSDIAMASFHATPVNKSGGCSNAVGGSRTTREETKQTKEVKKNKKNKKFRSDVGIRIAREDRQDDLMHVGAQFPSNEQVLQGSYDSCLKIDDDMLEEDEKYI